MPEPFDPYSQWLGIEPHELPVDHYRLLAIRRFESDPAVISAAADARMSHIRTFQTGPRAAYTQKLLNELATARVCLLNPGAKASYDQVLEAVFFTSRPHRNSQRSQARPLRLTKTSRTTKGQVTSSSSPHHRRGLRLRPSSLSYSLVQSRYSCYVSRDRRDLSCKRTRRQKLQSMNRSRSSWSTNREPVLIYQEANGSVNLDASIAQLHGPTLRLGISGGVNVIAEWESMDDWASWRFKVVKVPPQGIFHIHVTYAARPESDGGKFVIAVGDQEKVCEIRGTGEPVTDEYFIAVPNSGEYTLTVRAKSKPSQRLMDLKSLTLVFP